MHATVSADDIDRILDEIESDQQKQKQTLGSIKN